jgi:hypothetical protein
MLQTDADLSWDPCARCGCGYKFSMLKVDTIPVHRRVLLPRLPVDTGEVSMHVQPFCITGCLSAIPPARCVRLELRQICSTK